MPITRIPVAVSLSLTTVLLGQNGTGKSNLLDDSEADPKQTVVNTAIHSKRRSIREDMVPREGSGRRVGPGYSARLIEFVADTDKGWRPQVAAEGSESLRRCVQSLVL